MVRSNSAVLVAALAAWAFAAAAAPGADQPRIREIAIKGAQAYDRPAVLRIIRLKPGDTLWRDAAAVAGALEDRYHVQGYPAARVAGSFDAATGVLSLDVDEGRLVSVEVVGLEGKAQRHALEVLALETGTVLRDRDVTKALRRLEKASDGSVEADADEPYTVERVAEGGRLTVRLRPTGVRLSIVPGGPGTEPMTKVDGFAPWIGAEAEIRDPASYNNTNVYASGTYGFASHDPRYVLGIRRPFGSGRRLTLGYEFHDLSDSDDIYRLLGFEQAPSTIIATFTTRDYYRRKGHEAYGFVRLFQGAHLGLTWRGDEYSSLPVVSSGRFFSHAEARPNPAIDEGSMRSLIATFRWANRGELFGSRRRERDSFLLRSPYDTRLEEGQELRVEATYEVASPDLGGDFSFQRFIGNIRAARDVAASHQVRAHVLVGLTGGDVPVQRRFALGGMGTLRGFEIKSFSGDNAALASVEWLVRLPKPFPGLVGFYDGGSVWDSGTGQDWKSDLGVGVEWPAGQGFFLRADFAWPLQDDPGGKSSRFLIRFRLPI